MNKKDRFLVLFRHTFHCLFLWWISCLWHVWAIFEYKITNYLLFSHKSSGVTSIPCHLNAPCQFAQTDSTKFPPKLQMPSFAPKCRPQKQLKFAPKMYQILLWRGCCIFVCGRLTQSQKCKIDDDRIWEAAYSWESILSRLVWLTLIGECAGAKPTSRTI